MTSVRYVISLMTSPACWRLWARGSSASLTTACWNCPGTPALRARYPMTRTARRRATRRQGAVPSPRPVTGAALAARVTTPGDHLSVILSHPPGAACCPVTVVSQIVKTGNPERHARIDKGGLLDRSRQQRGSQGPHETGSPGLDLRALPEAAGLTSGCTEVMTLTHASPKLGVEDSLG